MMTSLIKRIKTEQPGTEIITYTNPHHLSDYHININKLMLSTKLFVRIRRKREPVLYFMAPSRIINAAIRSCVVSFYARGQLTVVLTMHVSHIGLIPRWLMKLSKARLVVASDAMCTDYSKTFHNEVHYVKAGIETQRFQTVDRQRKVELRRKYGIPEEGQVILHIGHMKEGRNISKLMDLDERFHILLVTSTYEYEKRDAHLREKLMQRKNVTLLEDYIPNIEEIYQMADVYFFPVVDERHCIATPLSVMEAASCNLPIVCTEFGELKQFKEKKGFFFINSFEPQRLNELVYQALQSTANTRICVEEYDWGNAVKKIIQIVEGSNLKGEHL